MALVCTNHLDLNSLNLDLETKQKLNETKIVKKKIAIINFTAIITALYLYERHNRYCEPGVYSLFSFLEYIVIVANIIYHLQAYHDLSNYSLVVANSKISTKCSDVDLTDGLQGLYDIKKVQ